MFYQIAFECYSIRWSVRMQIVVAWPQVSINPHHELTDELKEEKFHWKTAYFPFHQVQVLLASTRRFNVQFHRFYALTHLWLINIFYGSKVKLTLFNFIYNRRTGHNFNSGYRQSNGNKKTAHLIPHKKTTDNCTFTCSHFAHFSNLHITIHSEIKDNIQGATDVPASDPRSRDPLVHTTVIGGVHLGRPSNVRKWLKVTLTKALYHVERI